MSLAENAEDTEMKPMTTSDYSISNLIFTLGIVFLFAR